MPCTYTESPEEIAAAKLAANRRIIAPYKEKLDQLTRLMCSLMKEYDECDINTRQNWLNEWIGSNKELQDWWKEHKAADDAAAKHRNAKLRNEALNKLTKAEKRALGL